MAKDYKKTAQEVLRLVGGDDNVSHLEHCSTRLRFTLVEPGKADVAALKSTSGVMGVVASGPQCQVIIGNDVIEVFDELNKLGKFNAAAGAAPVDGGKKSIGAAILDFIVGAFQPLVPAIAGAGILKALLTVLTTCGILTNSDVLYKVFYYVADATLYYLPILVAVNVATKLNCNKLVAVGVVGAMIFPSTQSLLATEGGAKLFGFVIKNMNYTFQVFPALLTVMLLAFVEHKFTKICPKPVRVFLVPMVCFMIVFPIALLLLGPLGYELGEFLTAGILWLYAKFGWLAVGVLATILPFMIAMGMHKALVPYAVASIANPGYELLYMGASLAHNISEGAACLAVAVRTKNVDLRSTAISAGISGLFGITEPALYGVTLQHKRAMAGVCAGSLIAGLFVGIMQVKAFVAMGPGIAGMAMFLDPENSMNLVWACAGLVIAVAVAFFTTLLIYKDEATAAEPERAAVKNSVVCSPLQGKAIALSEVKDEVFSQGILGQGAAVIPEKGELYAPADGTINTVFETKHAITMTSDAGAEILMHVGMDTVQLKGQGYTAMVKDGDKVKKGQLLLKFDIAAIQAAGYDVTTPVIIANSDEFKIKPVLEGTIVQGEPLFELESI